MNGLYPWLWLCCWQIATRCPHGSCSAGSLSGGQKICRLGYIGLGNLDTNADANSEYADPEPDPAKNHFFGSIWTLTKQILHTKNPQKMESAARKWFIFLPVRHEETLLVGAISLLVQLRLACNHKFKIILYFWKTLLDNLVLHTLLKMSQSKGILSISITSVADPGCLSRIPDPTFFHPGSRIPEPHKRI